MTTWPIRYRFRAWWEGYDLSALQQRLARSIAPEPADEPRLPPATRRPLPRRAPPPPPSAAGRVAMLRPADGLLLPEADCILVDGICERGDPLATIVRNQAAGLAPGGVLLMRGLVLAGERAAVSARYNEWAAGEPVRPRLRSPEELIRVLGDARLSVLSNRPATEAYAADIERGWGDALDRIRSLHRDPAGRRLIPTLIDECGRWLKRVELLREGVIEVRHITAARRERSRR